MRKFVTYLVLVPLAIVILMFAAANREIVTLSFDPFSSVDPAFALKVPLFVVMFGFVIIGVLIGGAAAWLKQGKWRSKARNLQSEVEGLRRDIASRSERIETNNPATLPLPEPGNYYRSPAA